MTSFVIFVLLGFYVGVSILFFVLIIMTSVSAANPNAPRREYVSIRSFNNDMFTYAVTTSWNGGGYTTEGSLTPVSGGNSTNCPFGRILRENGKKLYPGANPGVTTYMVGVYDSVTFFNGYINPNSPVFQPMNTDKPTYMTDGVDGGTFDGTSNIGPGVYTAGDIVSTGPNGWIGLGPCVEGTVGPYGQIVYYNDSTIMLNAGNCNPGWQGYAEMRGDGTITVTSTITSRSTITGHDLHATSSITAGTNITANSTITGYDLHATSSITAGTNITANGSVSGNHFFMNNPASVGNIQFPAGTSAGVTRTGGFTKIYVNAAGTTDSSVIFLTYTGQASTGILSVEEVNVNPAAASSFRIVSSNDQDRGTVNYIIIN